MLDFSRSFSGAETQDQLCCPPHGGTKWFVSKDVHLVKNHSVLVERFRWSSSSVLSVKKSFGSVVIAVALTLGLAACSSSNSQSSPDSTIVDVELVPVSTVIDVRTPEEFSEGHVKGAKNLDFRNGEFEKSLPNLDKETTYSVYCRSGSRSADAVQLMRNAGFTNVVDLGAVEDAAKALSLPIVQN